MSLKRRESRKIYTLSKQQSVIGEIVRNRRMYLFTVPGVLYTFLFGYTTLPYMVIAFEKFNYQDGILSPWIGIENFRFFFESNRAWEVTRNTLFLNFYFLAIGTIVAVGLAILLNEIHHQFFIRIVQSTMLFPFFLSWVIVSYILYALLSTDKGVINNMLISFGLRRISWYSEVNLWRGILVMTRTWKTSGYSMIIYLAAISGVDDSLYEAAVIDGANRWQCIWRITLPLLSPTICILILMDLGRMFYGDFGMIYALVKDSGQLLPKVDIIDTYVYRMLRVTGNPSMAMAVGLCQSLLGFVLVVGMNKIARFFFPDGALF